MKNYDKLNFGRTLSEWNGDKNNHGDCFNYGSVSGCDEACPALNDKKCEIYKNVNDYFKKTSDCKEYCFKASSHNCCYDCHLRHECDEKCEEFNNKIEKQNCKNIDCDEYLI